MSILPDDQRTTQILVGFSRCWCQHKAEGLEKRRPLVIDGHGRQINKLFLTDRHVDKNVVVIAPPHDTRILQPLDDLLLQSPSSSYHEISTQRSHSNGVLVRIKNCDFNLCFLGCMTYVLYESNMLKAVEAKNIQPLSSDKTLHQFKPRVSGFQGRPAALS